MFVHKNLPYHNLSCSPKLHEALTFYKGLVSIYDLNCLLEANALAQKQYYMTVHAMKIVSFLMFIVLCLANQTLRVIEELFLFLKPKAFSGTKSKSLYQFCALQ